MAGLDRIIDRHRILICAGSGGVGKTTTAAAIALRAALRGRRTVVMTIDPAKRLADSLGVGPLGGSGTPVVSEDLAPGMLHALMLDQKGAWDQLVERHAPTPEVRARILENHFYQHLSESFAGSQEYMAIEQLCSLHESGDYDLVVVDTPPTRHALDFLESPQRIADFLDRNVMKWFLRPYLSAGWTTLRLFNRTAGFLFRRLEEATGVSALVQVSEFFASMSGLFENFEPRVRRVDALLRSPETAFVLVASPEEQVLAEARYFLGRIRGLGIELRAVVLNRSHPELSFRRKAVAEGEVRELMERLDLGAASPGLAENFRGYQVLGRGDAARLKSFRGVLDATVPLVTVPNLTSDVHSIDGLRGLHQYLFAED